MELQRQIFESIDAKLSCVEFEIFTVGGVGHERVLMPFKSEKFPSYQDLFKESKGEYLCFFRPKGKALVSVVSSQTYIYLEIFIQYIINTCMLA